MGLLHAPHHANAKSLTTDTAASSPYFEHAAQDDGIVPKDFQEPRTPDLGSGWLASVVRVLYQGAMGHHV
jgi:hypothetical protein